MSQSEVDELYADYCWTESGPIVRLHTNPTQSIAVDEAMFLFKGRSSMLEYNISKPPVKWGYKCWCSCDNTNCYMTWTFTRMLAVHWMRLPRCYSCSTYDGAIVCLQSQCLHRQRLKHIPGKQVEKQWNSNYRHCMDQQTWLA